MLWFKNMLTNDLVILTTSASLDICKENYPPKTSWFETIDDRTHKGIEFCPLRGLNMYGIRRAMMGQWTNMILGGETSNVKYLA